MILVVVVGKNLKMLWVLLEHCPVCFTWSVIPASRLFAKPDGQRVRIASITGFITSLMEMNFLVYLTGFVFFNAN